MNDRFKFRVWDKINDNWLYNQRLDCDTGFLVGFYNTVSAEKRRYILMQCTGLKDKNGKLIYEGDVINEMDFVKHIVIWSQEYCRFELKAISDNCLLDNLLEDTTEENRNHRIEVIGNIYENKELLDDTKPI